jgi:hypothetical protein
LFDQIDVAGDEIHKNRAMKSQQTEQIKQRTAFLAEKCGFPKNNQSDQQYAFDKQEDVESRLIVCLGELPIKTEGDRRVGV